MTRRHAPATERNREPLLEVFRPRLTGKVLELASGTGQHARYFTDHLDVQWQPTDGDAEALSSISAWSEGGRDGLLEPRVLNVMKPDWGVTDFDAVVACNLIHISPWEATGALFRGASAAVGAAGQVLLYGPFKIGGAHTSESNVRFEGWLHSLDERFGVRDLEAVQETAARQGFELHERLTMPANNFVLVFGKGQ